MKKLLCFMAGFVSVYVTANEYTYEEISKRHLNVSLTKKQTDALKMQGECLAGLKQLNFRKSDKFDPVAEWTSYRSLSPLEQFPPCDVLLMLEVASKEIRKNEN